MPRNLMRLQAQPPLRMLHAISDSQLCIHCAAGPIHRRQEEMPESKRHKLTRIETSLWIHQLQLISTSLH